MSLSVVVLGGGGHAKVLVDTLRASSFEIVGVVDTDPALEGSSLLGVPILGGEEVMGGFSPAKILLVNGIGSVRSTLKRRSIFLRFKKKGYLFATVVHPSSIVAYDAVLGEGAQVMAGTVIQPGSRIGCDVIVNTGATVDHDCTIGDHTHIAPGVTLSGSVSIGQDCHIGVGATIIQGVSVGDGAVIGAGALVLEDVPSSLTVVGVPARAVQR